MNNKLNKFTLFDAINYVLLAMLLVVTLYPFYYVLIASVSNGSQVMRGNVLWVPVEFTLAAYGGLSGVNHFWTSYGNTVFYTVAGMLVSMFVMSLGAYSLSRARLKGRKIFNFFISFTLWFNAGTIPIYLNIDSLGLLNTRAGLILGFAVNAFYIIIMRTAFEGVPIELEEAARVDGMRDWGIYSVIMLPVVKPMLATVALYCAIDRWNGYFWAMILINDVKKAPLQVLLKKLIVDNDIAISMGTGSELNFIQTTIIYAIIIVAVLPMIVVYPFIQKYFVKGLTVGAVKG